MIAGRCASSRLAGRPRRLRLADPGSADLPRLRPGRSAAAAGRHHRDGAGAGRANRSGDRVPARCGPRLRSGLVRGVVGWTDLAAPDAPARIAALGTASRCCAVCGRCCRTSPRPTGSCARPCSRRCKRWRRLGCGSMRLVAAAPSATAAGAVRTPSRAAGGDRSWRQAGDRAGRLAALGRRHRARRRRNRRFLQAVRPGHRGRRGLANCRSAPLCRPPAGLLRRRSG